MKNLKTVVCLFVVSAVVLTFASAVQCAGIVSETGAVLKIEGFLTDVHQKIVNSGEGIFPQGLMKVNDSVDIKVTSFVPDSPAPLEPVYVNFMKEMGNDLRCRVISDIGNEEGSLLSIHRKPLGLGVHGPVKISAYILIDWVEDRQGRKTLTAEISFETLEGPRGTFGLK